MNNYRNFLLILVFDILFFSCSFLASYLVRFDFSIPDSYLISCVVILPYVVIIKCLVFSFFDLYKGMWRYTGIVDLLNIIKASFVSSFLIISIILFYKHFIGFPRSVFLIDFCFTIMFISGFRLLIRFYFETYSRRTALKGWYQIFRFVFSKKDREIKKIVIIGAGDCGESIYREIASNPYLKYKVIGFLDDNLVKKGKKIHGVAVLGPIKQILELQDKAMEAIIAIPSASHSQIREIISLCKQSKMNFRIVPSIGELINGKVTINSIRKVTYKDLLGREDIKLDQQKIASYIKDKTVLVTGAGGSIGSELCRQICGFHPRAIILLEIAESPLYEIELELKKLVSDVEIITSLSDVKDADELDRVFIENGPQVVFHAAAYKHVPMLEAHPWQAIINNVTGTLNILNAAKKYHTEKFVLVSTDKAVRPANIMGASKRIAEMLVQNLYGLVSSKFITVRFGNVAGSVGSVIPLFKKQIKQGGPVTVTHKEVTRYFMTISEASQLILQAGAVCGEEKGNRGDIYILDMGVPIKIDDMANDMIRLSGFEPNVDIKIEYIGLRPGEKLYEELITDDENMVPTCHEKILVLKKGGNGLDHDDIRLKELIKAARCHDVYRIKKIISEIIPEYNDIDVN